MIKASFRELSRSLPAIGAWCALSALGPPAAHAACDDTTFGTALSLGLSPVQIHAGDVNGDGRIDIVSVENGAIRVLFGNGDGTFQAPVVTPGPATPGASVLGTWDSDGLVDLAVASGTSVTFLLGNATLGFVPGSGPYGAGTTVRWLSAGDFDRDSRTDVLVAGAVVAVFTGNGDGTFNLPAVATTLGAADVVRIGDFDGDHDPDLALLRRISSDVLVALNDGTGAFPVTRDPVPFPTAAQDLVTGDFDRDGRLDLGVISRSPNKALHVRLGIGNAFFEAIPRQTSLATNNPEFVVTGNFDGDAYPDLAVTQQGSIDFEILLGAGDGTFVTVFTQALGGGSPSGEAAADIDGDGLDDFVVAFDEQDRIVVNATGDACVSHVTATSTGGGGPTSGQNVLQWLSATAPGVTAVRIRYETSATAAGCTPPGDATSGTSPSIDLPVVSGRQTYAHGSLTPGTHYCYSVFARRGASYSPPRSVTARPFDSTGLVKWGFSTGGTAALAPPGNGVGVVHVVANNAVVHALEKGDGGGTWPDSLPEWKPRQLPGPSQGRPSTVGVPVGSATRLLFLGAQDGRVYALDAQTGGQVWRSPHLASMVQAAPSGAFVAFGGSHDFILVGTRDTGVPNAFYALRLADGTLAWTFDGEGRKIGPVNSQASVDYVGRRVYFTSLAYGAAPDNHTVWCVDLDTGTIEWSVPVGDVVGSPILRAARAGETSGRVYVGSWNGGTSTGLVHALDANTGAAVWASPFATGADGAVKSYVAADRLSATGRLFFSTTNRLWAIDDPPGSTASPAGPAWVRDGLTDPVATRIPTPSAPAYLAGGSWVFVGSGDGSVYRLDYATGDPATQVRIPVGDPAAPAAVGGPTLDLQASPRFLYAGTAGGVVYAVQFP